MTIPDFPTFVPVTFEMKDVLYPFLNLQTSGISELTFPSIFIHQKKYNYKVSCIKENQYVFSGTDLKGKSYFIVPGELPPIEVLKKLFKMFDYWGLMSAEQAKNPTVNFVFGTPQPDRDNWDYLYETEKLATLSGKILHKKRNLVNVFEKTYSPKVIPLTSENAEDAKKVLKEWLSSRGQSELDVEKNDFLTNMEALSHLNDLCFSGILVYVDDKPIAFSLGERFARGTMYVVHFEKGISSYKGVFQFVNMAFAKTVANSIKTINREQDLGDLGMRQAKETYRPCGFIQKFVLSQKIE